MIAAPCHASRAAVIYSRLQATRLQNINGGLALPRSTARRHQSSYTLVSSAGISGSTGGVPPGCSEVTGGQPTVKQVIDSDPIAKPRTKTSAVSSAALGL
jgi:hypothetical protein